MGGLSTNTPIGLRTPIVKISFHNLASKANFGVLKPKLQNANKRFKAKVYNKI